MSGFFFVKNCFYFCIKPKISMTKLKLSPKQKEVVTILRGGNIIHWMGGLTPRAFISHNTDYKISTATVFKLSDLGLIEKDISTHNYKDKYILTELGKTIEL